MGDATPIPQQGPPRPKRVCTHDSTRSDGWFDDHCLRCGADGVWLEGRRVQPREIVATRTHPSGKTLGRIKGMRGPVNFG